MNQKIHKRILQACYTFMVPVAKFLLAAGVSYKEFSQVCSEAFVHVASNDYGLRGRLTNLSRVSALTGISRKEVANIRKGNSNLAKDPRTRLSPLSDVLHYWHTDPKYLDSQGSPRDLSVHDGENSFKDLVKDCVGDLSPGLIKKELLRFGAVIVTGSGKLRVIKREAVPENFDEKLITSISFNLHGLATTIAHNSSPARMGPGRIERFIESGSLDPASKAELQAIIRQKIVAFSEEVDDLFADYDAVPFQRDERVGVGVYYYED